MSAVGGLLVVLLVLVIALALRERRRRYGPPWIGGDYPVDHYGQWWSMDDDGVVTWHDFPKRGA